VVAAGELLSGAAAAGEPFNTLLVDGRNGCEDAEALLAHAREVAAGGAVQGIVVLDTAAKADFARFKRRGFDAYLVRPVRPQSVLTHLGARPERHEEASASDAAGRDPPLRASAWALSVLLVEDNDINALLARRMLEKVGCTAHACLNGREAVDAMRRVLATADAPYDLVLMDVHMPVLDGLEATRMIKELYAVQADGALKPPPIVALTANAFEEDRRRCLEAGMDDYLAKPFDKDDLVRVLERWCADRGQSATRAA
jgi:CheY-like chemotaxis protein